MCILHIMITLLDALLAPLARLLVAQGVRFPDLAERLKGHYVAAAVDHTDGKVTDSRLSVMTGLQRRDVARLRAAPPRSERGNALSAVVARWQTDPDYRGKPIPRTGSAPSFEALAQTISRDVHPRTVLDTLVAAGTVAISGDTVALQQASYQPLAGSEDQVRYFAHNLGDHIAAATDNVLGATPPHFERAVHYTDLTDEQIEVLQQIHSERQMALFHDLSVQAAKMKSRNTKAQGRFRAGAFFFRSKDMK